VQLVEERGVAALQRDVQRRQAILVTSTHRKPQHQRPQLLRGTAATTLCNTTPHASATTATAAPGTQLG
jgi:hypothetical protein